MNILFLTNNKIAYPIYEFLLNRKDITLQKYEEKITCEYFNIYKPDLIISYNYKYIIRKDVIGLFPNKIINLHISLLPWNRGADPNIWSFIEDTPKGVTIHLIDEGIDTGKIILQKEVYIDENENTLDSSYNLLHNYIQQLFIENWENIKNGNISPYKQVGRGSLHYRRDLDLLRPFLVNKNWNIKIPELRKLYIEVKNGKTLTITKQ